MDSLNRSNSATSPFGVEMDELVVPCSLAKADLVFWDFDGVVKESVEVKTEGFVSLLPAAAPSVLDRVRAHHEANGGMSRFEKIPLYLAWAGQSTDEETVHIACSEFSRVVYKMVVDSPWVPGVREYLLQNPHEQMFVLVSATPDKEVKSIVSDLGLDDCFTSVHGFPRGKAEVIAEVVESGGWEANQVVVVGDSDSDRRAAEDNGVLFLWRKNGLNRQVVSEHAGPSFGDLING